MTDLYPPKHMLNKCRLNKLINTYKYIYTSFIILLYYILIQTNFWTKRLVLLMPHIETLPWAISSETRWTQRHFRNADKDNIIRKQREKRNRGRREGNGGARFEEKRLWLICHCPIGSLLPHNSKHESFPLNPLQSPPTDILTLS